MQTMQNSWQRPGRTPFSRHYLTALIGQLQSQLPTASITMIGTGKDEGIGTPFVVDAGGGIEVTLDEDSSVVLEIVHYLKSPGTFIYTNQRGNLLPLEYALASLGFMKAIIYL